MWRYILFSLCFFSPFSNVLTSWQRRTYTHTCCSFVVYIQSEDKCVNFPLSFSWALPKRCFLVPLRLRWPFVCALYSYSVCNAWMKLQSWRFLLRHRARLLQFTTPTASSQPSTSSSNNNTMWHETHVCRRMSSNFGNHIVRSIDTIKYAYTNLRGDENIFASVRNQHRMRLYVRACDNASSVCSRVYVRSSRWDGMQWAKQRNPPEIVNKKK